MLVELDILESTNGMWNPISTKKYQDFAAMVKAVGFVNLTNKNFQSVMKKQQKSFLANYDKCMKEIIGD